MKYQEFVILAKRTFLLELLKSNNWSPAAAAADSGLNRTHFYSILRKLVPDAKEIIKAERKWQRRRVTETIKQYRKEGRIL